MAKYCLLLIALVLPLVLENIKTSSRICINAELQVEKLSGVLTRHHKRLSHHFRTNVSRHRRHEHERHPTPQHLQQRMVNSDRSVEKFRSQQLMVNRQPIRLSLKTKPHLWQHLHHEGSKEFKMHSSYPVEEIKVDLIEKKLNDIREIKDFTKDFDGQEEGARNARHRTETVSLKCPKCENSQRRVEHISEEELTRLRIEFVKQQILEKLRLKDKPHVSAVGLPKLIYEGTTIQHENERAKSKDLDDYYARTNKKFIFLEKEENECHKLEPHPSICFSFKIEDADVEGFDVNTAVLWIFKIKQMTNSFSKESIIKQQTLVVSEVEQGINSKYLPKIKPIAMQSVDDQDGWVKIDIEWPIKRWFGIHELSHLIHISCESCEIDTMDTLISVDKDYRPFIMIDTQNRRRVSRQRRSINCTEGVTECCREKLYISFDDIGWGDWIIQPRGYDAYFCRGSCGSVASVTQSSSHHSTFLQKVSTQRRATGKKPLELTPCCTAKQFSSLQLFFIDSNNTATLKTFPNMVIESCGCR